MNQSSLLLSFLQTIQSKKLIKKNDTLLVGVSGGPDSMALLYLLNEIRVEWNLRLIVVHVNHLLRGDSAKKDEAFVKRVCKRLNVECVCEQHDVNAFAKINALSIEEAARNIRYEVFKRVGKEMKIKKLVLAHTLDDQAETMLMRILQGTGSQGLGGIYCKRKRKNIILIRPLLFSKKSELLAYLKVIRKSYCVDESNAKLCYERNKIRNKLLPSIRKNFSPNISDHLSKLASIMQDENEYIDSALEKQFSKICDKKKEEVSLRTKDFFALPEYLKNRCIRYMIDSLFPSFPRLTHKHIVSIKDFINSVGADLCVRPLKQIDLPKFNVMSDGQIISFVHKSLIVKNKKDSSKKNVSTQKGKLLTIKIPGVTKINKSNSIQASFVDAGSFEKRENTIAFFDYDLLVFPLILRSRKEGDAITLLGKSKKTKKIKDIFIDKKISRYERENIPIVLDAQNMILWIPGIKRSSHALVKRSTKKIVQLIYK